MYLKELPKVTRFVVVDHTKNGEGRITDVDNIILEFSLQDDDKTLKVFIMDRK